MAIYKKPPIEVMQSLGCTVYPGIADRVQKKIMFLALSRMKIKIINGMSADTLSRLQEPSWLLSLPASRCGSASWSIRNLGKSIMSEKNGYRLVRIIRISWCSNQHDRILPSLFIYLSLPLPLHPYPSTHKAGFRCLNMGVSCHW